MFKILKTSLAMKVSAITIAVNFLLFLVKIIAGIVGRSGAMISDAVHSASDVVSTFVVMVGVSISEKGNDDNHQYGHEKMECIAAIVLAALLFFTGGAIGLSGINAIINKEYIGVAVPTSIALVAAIISIVVKEWMYHYTKKAAKELNSGAMLADAWHHRSDALSSVGSLIGIGGAMMGFPILDSIAMIIIAVMILKASYEIAQDGIDKLVDKAVDEETMNSMKAVAEETQGVICVDLIRSRLFGNKFYVDIEICCDSGITLKEAHQIAEKVHDKIEEKFPNAKHCMVHVNPEGAHKS